MHFASFEVVSVKDLKLYKGHLSFLWTLTKAGKTWNRLSTFNGQNGITWSVFCKPQRRKNVITWPEFFNRELKPTVPEASRKKALVHGRLRWIVYPFKVMLFYCLLIVHSIAIPMCFYFEQAFAFKTAFDCSCNRNYLTTLFVFRLSSTKCGNNFSRNCASAPSLTAGYIGTGTVKTPALFCAN